VPQVFNVRDRHARPPGFTVDAGQAIEIANRQPAIRKLIRSQPGVRALAAISPLQLAPGFIYHWTIEYMGPRSDEIIGEVQIGPTGHVFETTTGVDVGWPLIHGYPGVLGHKLNAPYIWLPLCLLFLLPFFDPRRPLRILHLDLLVLLAFGASQFFFNLGKPAVSTPLIYPALIYLAARCVVAAYRPRARAGPLVPLMRSQMLAVLLATLVVLKVVFSFAGSGQIDVAYAGVVGADRIVHGLPLYTDNDFHPDTYGPLNYLAYVPFEAAFPFDLQDPNMTAARLATLTFDFLTLLGLFLLGRRLRSGPSGTRLGLALALAWTAYPYTGLVIASNTNDALVPLFIVYGLVGVRSPAARGAALGLATMTKFIPGLLAPAFAGGLARIRLRSAVVFSAAFAIVCVALIAPFIPDGGLREIWNTTVGFQIKRTSPLSIWGRHPDLEWLQTTIKAAVIAFAASTAFWPRRRSVGQLAALCGAILIGTQLVAGYWLYFYLVWFAPFVLIATFVEHRELGPYDERVTSDLVKPVRMSQPDSVATTRSSILTPSEPGR